MLGSGGKKQETEVRTSRPPCPRLAKKVQGSGQNPKLVPANFRQALGNCAKKKKPASEQGRGSAARPDSTPADALWLPLPSASHRPNRGTYPGGAPGHAPTRPPRLRVGLQGSAPPWTGPAPSPPNLAVFAFYLSRSRLQQRRHVLGSSGRLQIFSFHSF